MKAKLLLLMLICTVFILPTAAFAEQVKGIYITQNTLENTARLTYLIQQAKASGINTFVIDQGKVGNAYRKNIELVKQNGLRFVSRVVVFTDGGTDAQVLSQPYWEKKYQSIQQMVALGAQEIQLDYIRYNSKQPASPQNAKNVVKVIQWYKDKLAAQNIPLQVDVFGVTGIKEEFHIGQNVQLMGPHVDAMCPMVYPSHFEPFRAHAVTPYQTVLSSLNALKKQFPNNQTPFKLIPYIELSNYRYPLSTEQRHAYINAQLKAVKDAGADGWYAWSPSNRYDNLFHVLQSQPQSTVASAL